jgi:predicted dehydrogenase
MATMSKPVRWGILATGGIATEFVTDLRLAPDAEVLAVGSRSAEAADRFAATHGIPRAYPTWAALAADPDVEIVYVAGPHVAHYAAAKAILSAGKAVLCEKPITINAAEAEDLVATAKANDVFLAEAMWMWTNPAVRRCAQLASDGAIGDVTGLAADFSFPSGAGPEHRLANPALGGGALLDLGVYVLALAQLLSGAPETVAATARLSDQGVDETTGILLGYPGGRHALLSVSYTTFGTITATVTGTAGRLVLPHRFFRARAVEIHPADGPVESIELPAEGSGLRFPAIEAGRCLRAGLTESPLLPHADTLAVMRTMDRIRAQIGVVYPSERR